MSVPPDEEMIATFLEGKLTTSERDRVMAWLADSEEARTLVAEMARTLEELGDRADIVSSSPASRRALARWWWMPLAAAAVLLLLLLPGRASFNSSGIGIETVALLSGVELPSGADAIDARWGAGVLDPPWSSLRGATDGPELGARRVAFRLGLLIGRLDLASRAADTVFSERMSEYLQRTLLSVPKSEALSARATRLLGAAPSPEAWWALGSELRERTESQWFDLGRLGGCRTARENHAGGRRPGWPRSARPTHHAGGSSRSDRRSRCSLDVARRWEWGASGR